jgi:hypothetical protein
MKNAQKHNPIINRYVNKMVPPPIKKRQLRILHAISKRFKDNSVATSKRVPIETKDGEYEIDQILCDEENDDKTTMFLVKWRFYDCPTWVEPNKIPGEIRRKYYDQGKVSLKNYSALCDLLMIREKNIEQ